MNKFNENDAKYNENTYIKSNPRKIKHLRDNINKFGRLVVSHYETATNPKISKNHKSSIKKMILRDLERFYNENKALAESDIFGYTLTHRRVIYDDLRIIERIIRVTTKCNKINTLSDIVRRNRW